MYVVEGHVNNQSDRRPAANITSVRSQFAHIASDGSRRGLVLRTKGSVDRGVPWP